MKGDQGPGGDGEWQYPYPLPGQDWGQPDVDVPADQRHLFEPPKVPGMPSEPEADGPSGVPPPGSPPPGPPPPRLPPPGVSVPKGAFPAIGGLAGRSEVRGTLVKILIPIMISVVMVVGFLAWSMSRLNSASQNLGRGIDSLSPVPMPPTPEPEPVSTVPPKLKGWKAVTSAKYGFTYDVPQSWRILSPTTIRGYEGVNGGKTIGMSSVAVFNEDACTDGNERFDRGSIGFNQYTGGEPADVAKHAANKWAVGAYSTDGSAAPAVTLGEPETVRVGRAEAVRVRAEVTLKAKGKCLPPTAIVHTVAVPGTAAGKTTVLVVLADQGLPDAAPQRALTRIVGTLRPS